MADVVQQRREPHGQPVLLGDAGQLAALLQRRERFPGQVVGAERVLEAGMGGARVDEEGVAELADVTEALDRRCVERRDGGAVEPDVVPERIADDFEVGGLGHRAQPARERRPRRGGRTRVRRQALWGAAVRSVIADPKHATAH